MKIVRIILVLVALLFLLVIGIGLFGPSGIDMSYKKVLKAPISSVYGHVSDFEKWPNWSPWAEMDTAMVVTYGEISKGEGASYSWNGPATGVGQMDIREAVQNEMLGMDIGFDMGDGMEFSKCDMQFAEVDGGTEVTWNFNSSGQDGFSARIMNVVMPSLLKGMYEKGLANLEREALAHPMESSNKKPMKKGAMEKTMQGFWYVGERYSDFVISESNPEAMSALYGESFGKIFQGAGENASKILEPPLSINEAYDRETTKSTFIVAMQTSEELTLEGLTSGYVKPHKAMVMTHYGPYENISESYEKLMKIIIGSGQTALFPSYELYITDPESVSDMSELETLLVVPVEWM